VRLVIEGVEPSRKGAGSALIRVVGLSVVVCVFCLLAANPVRSGEPVDEPVTEPIKHAPGGDLSDEFDRDPNPGINPDPEPFAVSPEEIVLLGPSEGSTPQWAARELSRSILPSWVVQLRLIVAVAVH
jgi:hypothetical protein